MSPEILLSLISLCFSFIDFLIILLKYILKKKKKKYILMVLKLLTCYNDVIFKLK